MLKTPVLLDVKLGFLDGLQGGKIAALDFFMSFPIGKGMRQQPRRCYPRGEQNHQYIFHWGFTSRVSISMKK